MYSCNILIISQRKELSVKYKKLIEALGQNVSYTDDLSKALSIIQKQEVEFIIISDTINESLSDFISKIRILSYNIRPIIIAISKSSELKDKIKILKAGADDLLGEEITKQEFQIRFQAHLRRYLEGFLNTSTKLPEKNITIKALKKTIIENKEDISYLLIKIKGAKLYTSLYGEIASQKVFQTLAAIINSICAEDDFVGHIKEDEFILITQTIKAEKIASFLVFAFDNVLNKFYSDDEFKNNFTIQTSNITGEAKQNLMRLNIASIEKTKDIKDYRDIINNLENIINKIKICNKSTYIIDRIKLEGEVNYSSLANTILVAEPDISLSYLLKNVFEMNNIEVKCTSEEEDFYSIYKKINPKVIILDWSYKDKNNNFSIDIAKEISNDDIKIIFSSSYLNKKEILKAGADIYLPKPYEIDKLLDEIKKILDM